ncbi:unnamed protein product, partial [Allacma fusca]
MHLIPPNPVEPKELDDFLSGGKDGFILFRIPMMADQPSNMRKAAKKGFALPPLEFGELTEEILVGAINEAIYNSSYRETAHKLSKIFLDQETKPLDRAVYWVDCQVTLVRQEPSTGNETPRPRQSQYAFTLASPLKRAISSALLQIVSRSRAAREVQLVQILPHSPAAGKQINYNKYLKTSVLMQSSKMKLNLSSTLLLPWLLVFLTSIQMEEVSSAKILTISFMSSKSHRITYEPLLRELARRGHEVTAIGPILSKDEKNFKNIQTINQEKSFSKGPNFFDLKLNMPAWLEGFFNAYLFLGHRLVGMCHDSYNLPQVQKVLNETWDMVFFTPLLNECLYGLVYKLNTTTVIYTQTTVFTWLADNLGTPNPPSHVSSILIGYDERMNFGQRFFNVFRSVYDWAILNFYYFPMAQSAYRTLLGDPTIPSIQEIERNASIVLMNSHISFSPPRPLLPDIIEVGGMHLIPSKPVQPKELDDFLSGGKDGFILFSM